MKKTIILFLMIFACKEMKATKIPANSIENLVISKTPQLFDNSSNNAKIIKTLNFLDTIYVLNDKIINGKVNVQSIKGIKGWIKYNDISLLKESKRIDLIKGLKLYFSADVPIIFKNKKIAENALKKNVISYEFSNNNYRISIINILNDDYEKLKKRQKKNYKEQAEYEASSPYPDPFYKMFGPLVIEKFIFNNLNSLYISWYELHDRIRFYRIYIPGKNKDIFGITVYLKKRKYTPAEEILAKKILFSARVK